MGFSDLLQTKTTCFGLVLYTFLLGFGDHIEYIR